MSGLARQSLNKHTISKSNATLYELLFLSIRIDGNANTHSSNRDEMQLCTLLGSDIRFLYDLSRVTKRF